MAAPVKRSFTVSEHLDHFIAKQVETGRFANSSEVVRAGLRLLEDRETRLAELRTQIDEADQQIAEGKGIKIDDVDAWADDVVQRGKKRFAQQRGRERFAQKS